MIEAWIEQFQGGLFVFARLSALFLAMPLLGGSGAPNVVRVGLSAVMAVILTPVVPHGPVQGPALTIAALAKEIVVGLSLGWIGAVLFASVQMAGEWLDLHGGFQAAHIYNPAFESANGLIGNLQHLLAGIVFFGSGGHLVMLRGAAASFAMSPAGVLAVDLGTETGWTNLVARTVWLAVQLAAPVAATLLLVEIILAFIHRAMPQVNLAMLTLPAKAWVALAAVALSIPALARVLELVFRDLGMQLWS